MKKKMIYLAPEVLIVDLDHPNLLAGSGVSSNSYVDTEYGGVDTGGTLDPSAREFEFDVTDTKDNSDEDDWMDEEEDW